MVHYGDTHGYDKDQPRPNAWPYRDYVIRAFNADKPYARFVREQVAGDVLFPARPTASTALGFIAAGPWDFIGHAEVPETKIDGKVARHLDRDDMVANTMNTFASLTVQCAQCHNHKFDPIRQEDYYRLQAVFAALDRADRPYYADPATAARAAELDAAAQRRCDDARRARGRGARVRAGPSWPSSTARSPPRASRPAPDAAEFGYHSGIEPDADRIKWVQVDLGRSATLERVVLCAAVTTTSTASAPASGSRRGSRSSCRDDPDFKTGVVGDRRPDRGRRAEPRHRRRRRSPAGGKSGRYVRVTATKLAPRQNDFIFALAELEVFDADGQEPAAGAPVTALDSIEAPPRWRKANLIDGYAPAGAAGADDSAALDGERRGADRAHADRRRERLAEVAAELAAVEAELAKVAADGAGLCRHGPRRRRLGLPRDRARRRQAPADPRPAAGRREEPRPGGRPRRARRRRRSCPATSTCRPTTPKATAAPPSPAG